MADGALTLTLDDETAARLEAAAREAGLSPEAWATSMLSDALQEPSYDWAEADRRLAEYDQTGAFVTLGDALARFDEALEAKLAAKR